MQTLSPSDAVSVPGQYWQWQGHDIYYVKAGENNQDSPPLLLVHGFGASTDHWRKNIAELKENYPVYAIDLLGFGRSAKPNLEYSGALWRDQLNDFVQEVIGRPAILAGNSLGGYASLCMAAQCPESALGVVLINSAGPFSDATPSRPNLFQRLMRSLLLQPLPSYLLFQYVRRPANIRKTLKKVYLDANAVTEQLVQDIYRPSCDQGAVQVFASVFRSPQGDKIDTLLQQLTCPLLMLWGEGDPWINTRERGAKFRQYYPNLTEHYLKAGHCPHDEIPQQVDHLMTQWIKEELFFIQGS
ncbi:MAG: alpha/beta fold hydrolase [Microcystaceae cyanobacterium]